MIEQTVNMNFCTELQKLPSGTLDMLKTVYGEYPGQRSQSRRQKNVEECHLLGCGAV
jgi:hypothetical protein